jgi:hypothetical protein
MNKSALHEREKESWRIVLFAEGAKPVGRHAVIGKHAGVGFAICNTATNERIEQDFRGMEKRWFERDRQCALNVLKSRHR